MLFDISNAPFTFMRLMIKVLKSLWRTCVVVYFYDILVFNKNKEDHIKNVRMVLETLNENQLDLNLEKCDFFYTKLSFLGFIIGSKRLRVDPMKTGVLDNWLVLASITEVRRSFMGLAGFFL